MTAPRLLRSLVAALLPCLAAFAQCEPQWLQGEPIGNISSSINDSTIWDPDGAGPTAPMLVVVGQISAGEVWEGCIAAWDGAQWLRLGAPPADRGRSVVVWNGNLVASFDTPGNTAKVMSWNGTSWQDLGTFLGAVNASCYATLAVHQGNLFVATNCTQAQGVAIPSVAQWTGSAWVGVGNGPPATAMHMISFQNVLYAACRPSFSLNGQLATWNGVAWTVVATCNRTIDALAVRSGTSITNSFLYVGGSFSQWTGINGTVAGPVVRFSPSANQWTGLGFTASVGVNDLAVRSTGLNTTEVVAVEFNGLWQQSGASWVQLGSPIFNSTSVAYHNAAWHLMSYQGFNPAQQLQAGSWVPLTPQASTSPLGQVFAARAAGSDTIVGSRLGLWRGQAGNWSNLGGLSGGVEEIARMANGDLVVAGVFTAPGLPANVRIARWNGVSWSPLATSSNSTTLALLPLPNGDLIAGGSFTSIGGVNIPYLARWTAGTWQPLGGGVNNIVRALLRLPNGDIVAGGDFTLAGSLTNTAQYAARWDGNAWTAMSAPAPVTSLATEASGTLVAASNGVRRWGGSSWQLVVASSASSVLALPNGDLMVSKFFPTGGLARIAPDGTVRKTYGIADGVTDLVLAEDGDILVAGNIDGVTGVASAGVARLDAPCPATSAIAGAGCTGSAGPLVLTPTDLPWLGGTFRGVATGLPALAFGVGVTGFAPTSVPLLSLFPAAVAGCTLHAQPDLLEVVLATAGSVTVQLVVPNNPVLIGLVVQHQVVSLQSDAALNFTEVTATNSLQLTLGTL